MHSRIKALFGKTKKQKKQRKKLKQQKNERKSKGTLEDHLYGAHFRWINSLMYNSTGEEAMAEIAGNKEQFRQYHTTYNAIVERQWPENPLDLILESITSKLKKKKNGELVVADFGCGDAKIARHFASDKSVNVRSFDLVALNKHVTACDISDVSEYLEDESVDIAVFCLSLMGKNFHEYLCEAYRVLKKGGSLKVAEVKSRIISNNKFERFLNRCGFAVDVKLLKNTHFALFHCRVDPKRICQIPWDFDPTTVLKPCNYKKR